MRFKATFGFTAALLLGGDPASAQNSTLRLVVEPIFAEGLHTGCAIQFTIRMGVEQLLPYDTLASGSFNLWRDGADIHAMMKLSFVGTEESKPPETAFLIHEFKTNFVDFTMSMPADDGRYSIFGYRMGQNTFDILEAISADDKGLTVGFTMPDRDTTRRFSVRLSRQQRTDWSACWRQLQDDALEVLEQRLTEEATP